MCEQCMRVFYAQQFLSRDTETEKMLIEQERITKYETWLNYMLFVRQQSMRADAQTE
jgi:hypothetical protein